MNTRIKNYIPKAMKILDSYQASIGNRNIDKELKGYIASLGPAILMNGLIPTLAVYASNDSNAQANRFVILDWLYRLLNKAEIADIESIVYNNREAMQVEQTRHANNFFKYVIDEVPKNQYNLIEQEILDASVSLKLCIRTFQLTI